jgi:hypothetical protein
MRTSISHTHLYPVTLSFHKLARQATLSNVCPVHHPTFTLPFLPTRPRLALTHLPQQRPCPQDNDGCTACTFVPALRPLSLSLSLSPLPRSPLLPVPPTRSFCMSGIQGSPLRRLPLNRTSRSPPPPPRPPFSPPSSLAQAVVTASCLRGTSFDVLFLQKSRNLDKPVNPHYHRSLAYTHMCHTLTRTHTSHTHARCTCAHAFGKKEHGHARYSTLQRASVSVYRKKEVGAVHNREEVASNLRRQRQ